MPDTACSKTPSQAESTVSCCGSTQPRVPWVYTAARVLPAALENWARRRGTLAASENEVHQGLDDTDLMLKTVQAEFVARNCFKVA